MTHEADAMRRRARILATLVLPAMLLAAMSSAADASVIEDYARVIRSRHAGASFSQVDGCRQVEVFVSAMDAKFGSLHGTINKQGLVGVFYAERDICAEPGPKGFPIVYSADGFTLDRLASNAQFTKAWLAVTVPATDSDGNDLEMRLDLHWSPTEPLRRSKVSGNGWFPAGGQQGAHVHTFSHGLSAAAMAWGEVTLDGHRLNLAPTYDATLEQVRYFCQVIQHPQGGWDVDCTPH
jgi:hypothetical protein